MRTPSFYEKPIMRIKNTQTESKIILGDFLIGNKRMDKKQKNIKFKIPRIMYSSVKTLFDLSIKEVFCVPLYMTSYSITEATPSLKM